jgi:phage baseplate assembly protein gpV
MSHIADLLAQRTQARSDRLCGLYVGIVVDNEDPEQLGRIKVRLPELDDTLETTWAKIVRPMAGQNRGFFFMPEVDDEVVVAFQQGMIDHAVILGGTYNGVDTPPLDGGIDVQVRRFQSVQGHIIEFDDRDAEKRVLLKSAGGHLVEMKDPGGTIEIKTQNGQQILMEDTPGKITLETNLGAKVTIDGAAGEVKAEVPAGVSITISNTGITVNAPAGSVTVNALNATLNAGASATINAPTLTAAGGAMTFSSGIATFTGVVQCSTLITNAVVSSAYTPGVGNLI